MGKIWAWILLSSKDPAKTSLMIKSAGYASATYVIFFAGLFQKTVGADDLNVLTNNVANFVGLVLMGISVLSGIIGTLRKIIRTVRGTNQVIVQEVEL